ncbi:DUF3617 domain-containing protein [Variovorax sp. PCZ-1]|uniref:DUF3617 domain-containing protein n=1 Tax=Variovorax sp. PCZ-1 TaxID=2835533 RepID=UPI001BCEB251|nr:DUF3617 domain-containing protein [Variovorax sp. PCZ-1]MBS7808407.1 DUF3617 domain-containing protein [Variovorax sp. PCZ-1]
MRIAFIISSVFIASLAFAQSSNKPGLWEVTSKMTAPANPQLAKQMEEAQKAMASMPAAQRKQMEEMMAKQGVSMSFGAGGTTAVKVCITPDMANRLPIEQRQGCTYKFSQSGATHNFSFQCTNPPGDGEGQFTFSDADNYSGKMRVTSTQGGKKDTMDIQTTGKFLGTNCGNVKPMPMATK